MKKVWISPNFFLINQYANDNAGDTENQYKYRCAKFAKILFEYLHFLHVHDEWWS